jgi:hypothetical protein
MLRTFLAVLVTALSISPASSFATGVKPPDAKYLKSHQEKIDACIAQGPNFQGRFSVCSGSKGTNQGYWVALIDLQTMQVKRLKDAELGVTIGTYGTGEFPKEFIVYNPEFSQILAWSAEVPESIWCTYYTLDTTLSLVEEIKTKQQFTQ